MDWQWLIRLKDYSWIKPPLFDVSLKQYTTIKSGGRGKSLVFISNEEEAVFLLHFLHQYRVPWFPLGRGSNTLFTDQGFEGVIIQLSGDFKTIALCENHTLNCGAGVTTMNLAHSARKYGLSGAEFLSTIPGTLGGAVFMNAGAHGCEIKNILLEVTWLETNGIKKSQHLLDDFFAYRYSNFMQKKAIILLIKLQLSSQDTRHIVEAEKKLRERRRLTQPIQAATWGSIFVNPTSGISAGKLIESCGLKGKGFGGARISPVHANFLENYNRACFSDIKKTILLAQKTVQKKYNVLLKTEVRVIDKLGENIFL